MPSLLRTAALAAALAVFTTTCTGLKSGNCGDNGQACCTGATCNALLACSPANTCAPCGDLLQSCCPQDSCGGNLVCNTGVCADAACSEACLPTTKRCNAASGIDACTQVGRCASWTTLLASCPTGQDCVASGTDATCVERCPGSCTLDALVCSSTGLKKCVLDTGTNCPALQAFTDDSTAPTCLTGACAGDWCWESPQPQGTTLTSLDGWAIDQFWALDAYGNILRRDGNGWAYEYRAQPLKTLRALTQCGSTNGYLIAVGDNGTVLRRVFGGTWVPEDIGDASAQLKAVSCTSFFRAFAVGAGGKAFVRDELASGTWRALASNAGTATLRGAAYYYSTGDGYAVGDNGLVVRCRDLNVPSTAVCGVETTSVTSELDAVKANALNGDIVAAGRSGVVLLRPAGSTGWTRVATALTAEDLHAVGVFADAQSTFFVVGASGVHLRGSANTWNLESPGGAGLNAVFAADKTTVIAGGDQGALWFNRSSGVKSGWNELGGVTPVPASLRGVAGLSPDELWAVGEGAAVYRRHAEVWSKESTATVVQGELYGVAVADGGEVFAVGDTTGNKILVGNGGRWVAEASPSPEPLFGVFADDARAYAVGNNGAWLERARGAGGTWQSAGQTASAQLLLAVTGRVVNGRAVEVTAVGGNCTVVTRGADGGFSSSSPAGCAGDALLSAWQGPTGELLVGGESAFVARRVGGTWTREYLGATLERVQGVAQNGNRSWAACENGEIYVRANSTWQSAADLLWARSFTGAWANTLGDVWVVGTGGAILRGR